MKRTILSICLLLPAVFQASARSLPAEPAFRVATVLGTGMVVQQGKPLTVWGTAPPGDMVSLTTDWTARPVAARADSQGTWELLVAVPRVRAGDYGPHWLEVVHGHDTVKMQDVLIGEVWLCSGQSNMDFTMKPFLPWLRGVVDYATEIAAANHPSIRMVDIPTDFKARPTDTVRPCRWVRCTPRSAGDFSAVAYYFARTLLDSLHVPVGLVVSAVGGASAEAFTSRKALTSTPALYRKYLYPYDTSARFREPLDTTVTFEKVLRPTLFYNAMIYPLRRLSIRGFLWYQGESNRADGDRYDRLCGAMLDGWRKDFAQGYLPFYFVQMTPYNWGAEDPRADDYARLREAQARMLEIKNTDMVVTMDIGEPRDIHPRDKKDVGVRLAVKALHGTYHRDIVYEGPRLACFAVRGDSVVLRFVYQSTGSGLSTRDGKPPRCFFLAGGDRVFHPARAVIRGRRVVLHAEGVERPLAVRYAFTNGAVTNFCNREGFAGQPFRTDAWR